MRLPLGPEFGDERRRYGFRFCCEDCVYFLRGEGPDRCAHGWPQQEHRLAHYEDEHCRELVFCKEFEIA